MGFYLMAPAFVCYRRWPRTAAVFLLLGLFAGGVIGLRGGRRGPLPQRRAVVGRNRVLHWFGAGRAV